MLRPLAFTVIVAAVAGAASPAFALQCYGVDSGSPRFTMSFGIGFGEFKEEDELRFYANRLQRRGVDTDQVEFWNGCLRAYVRKPGGGMRMEYYDPDTLQQVFP